jgi:hypothetical protein
MKRSEIIEKNIYSYFRIMNKDFEDENKKNRLLYKYKSKILKYNKDEIRKVAVKIIETKNERMLFTIWLNIVALTGDF